MENDFGHWLAGFIDGEGCFQIVSNGGYYTPRFSVKVRADEKSIIERIRRKTGIGTITTYPYNGLKGNPQVNWNVNSRQDCRALSDLLDKYPLRAKKAADFAIWRQAARLTGRGHQAQLAALRDDLKATREYK
jgi:hypothetical protein